MPIIDSQVHAYAANTPDRPWHMTPNWPPSVNGEEMVAAMDAVGVDGAILVNAFRVALTGWLTHSFGAGAAEGMIHTTEGFFTFGLAFLALLLEAALLRAYWPRSWNMKLI